MSERPVILAFHDALVVELLERLEAAPRTAPSKLLAELFRARRLKPRQQKRVKELFHEVLARDALIERAIDAATPNGVVQTLRQPVRVLTCRVMRGDLAPAEAGRLLPWIDWQRARGVPDEVRSAADPVARAALLGSLPDWLVVRLRRQYGSGCDALVESLATGRAPVTLRANALRCSRRQLAARLEAEDGIATTPVPLSVHALEVTSPARVFATAAWRDGWFEMQDAASQLIAEVTAPPPGGRVLDACAGAGGKTLAVAALLAGRGEILAVDSQAGRLRELRQRARRAGVHAYRAQQVGEAAWPPEVADFAARADRILVDAPCSGLGSMRRNPDVRWLLDEPAWRRLQDVQLGLATRAARALRPGARLIYATCTVLREENEAVVEAVRAAVPDLEPVPVAEVLGGDRARPLSPDGSGCHLQTLPNRDGADGFFAAVLRRPRTRRETT